MQQYKVNYNVGESTLTQFITTVVTATSPGQAQALVESMNGGSSNCHVNYVHQIFN